MNILLSAITIYRIKHPFVSLTMLLRFKPPVIYLIVFAIVKRFFAAHLTNKNILFAKQKRQFIQSSLFIRYCMINFTLSIKTKGSANKRQKKPI